jgi:hypothetical protein
MLINTSLFKFSHVYSTCYLTRPRKVTRGMELARQFVLLRNSPRKSSQQRQHFSQQAFAQRILSIQATRTQAGV